MKRIGTFLLALMLALAVPAPCFAAVDEKTVEAPSAVLVSAGTGAVLFEKNAHDRRSPASVTKLMTMLLVAALYLGQQVYDIIFAHDNVANFMHIVGGVCGTAFGYVYAMLPRKRRRPAARKKR